MDPQIPIQNTQQVALIVVPIVFDLLAIAAVALRVLARRVSNRRLDASDYVMFAALLFTTGFSGLLVAEAFTGGGLHMTWLVETYGGAPLVTYLKMTVANQCLWALSVCLPKISALLLYSKIFSMPAFIFAAKINGVLVLCLAIATILGALLQCQPLAFNWDQTIPGGHCGNQVLSYKVTGGLNVTLDVFTLLLPMPYLATLAMPIYQKAVLIATFAIGFVTCAISALRINSIVSMDYSDLTYLAVTPSVYSILEPTVAIILACVPLLRPLFGGKYSATGTRLRIGKSTMTSGRSGTTAGSSNAMSPRSLNPRISKFQKLDDVAIVEGDSGDDSSQIELRPAGPEYQAHVSAQTPVNCDKVQKERSEVPGNEIGDKGIVVKQHWEVRGFKESTQVV